MELHLKLLYVLLQILVIHRLRLKLHLTNRCSISLLPSNPFWRNASLTQHGDNSISGRWLHGLACFCPCHCHELSCQLISPALGFLWQILEFSILHVLVFLRYTLISGIDNFHSLPSSIRVAVLGHTNLGILQSLQILLVFRVFNSCSFHYHNVW